MPQVGDRSLLAKLDTQPRVRDFLVRAYGQGRTSHAYLFLGAPGAGKLDAAWALSQALLCEGAVAGHVIHAFAWRGTPTPMCTTTPPDRRSVI